MKYERLTDRILAEMLINTEGESWDRDNIEAQCYIRLAELEDKIENGEIDYVADRDKEISRLTAENAELRATLSKMETVEKELRERLEKAVELPRIIHPNKSEWHIQYQYESGIIDSDIRFFIEAAEARLAELKGEKK